MGLTTNLTHSLNKVLIPEMRLISLKKVVERAINSVDSYKYEDSSPPKVKGILA